MTSMDSPAFLSNAEYHDVHGFSSILMKPEYHDTYMDSLAFLSSTEYHDMYMDFPAFLSNTEYHDM